MKQPATVRDVLELLQEQHNARGAAYRELSSRDVAPEAQLLLDRLTTLEAESVTILSKELERMPERTAFLASGPPVSHDAVNPTGCQHDSNPTFEEVLDCAFQTRTIAELLHRLEGIAAESVRELLERLKGQEDARLRQVASLSNLS